METVVIARSTSDVFAFTVDLRNEPLWDLDVEMAPGETEAALEVGKEHRVKFAPFLGESEGTLTAVEVEPGARLVLEGQFVGLTWTITYLYKTEGGGTQFTRQVEVRPLGMLRLVEPIIARRVRRTNRRDVLNLKRVLEAS